MTRRGPRRQARVLDPARLLFIGLWNFACDNGHLQDKPKQIKMRIFPGDDVNATELLTPSPGPGRTPERPEAPVFCNAP